MRPSRDNGAQRFSVLVLGIAILVGVLLALWVNATTSRKEGHALPGVEASSADAAGNREGEARTVTRAAVYDAKDRRIRVTVTDRMQAPVSGASVARSERLYRIASSSTEEVMGSSDAEGVFTLSGGEGDNVPPYLIIRKRGFVTAVVEHPSWGDEVAVQLDRAEELRARVVDSGGNGIAGARLVLSMCALGAMDLDQVGVPGPVAKESIHSGVSDEMGRILIQDLAPGRYDFRITHPAYAWAGGGDDVEPPMAVPGPPVMFTMHRIVGCYKRIVGTRVLAQSGGFGGAVGHWHWMAVERMLRAKMGLGDPNTIIVLGLDGYVEGVPQGRVFLEGAGWKELDLKWRPLAIGDGPEIVEVASNASEDYKAGKFVVELRNRAGSLLKVDRISLIARKEGFEAYCQNGIEGEAPWGEYLIMTSEPFLQDALRNAVLTVGSGTAARFERHLDFAPCRWEFQLESGRAVPGPVAVGISEGRGKPGGPPVVVQSGQEMLLPVGALTVNPVGMAYRGDPIDIEVPENGMVIKCTMH